MAERVSQDVSPEDLIKTANAISTTDATSSDPLDIYALNRQFERDWLGGTSIDSPRPDQHGTNDTFERSRPPRPRVKGEHVMTIVYNFEDETVQYLHRGDPGFEIETPPNEETT